MASLEAIASVPYREDGWEVVEKSTGRLVRSGLTWDQTKKVIAEHQPVRKAFGTPDGIYTVAVDLHHTLADGWAGDDPSKPGPPLAGAKEAMQAFCDAGYRTVINSVLGDCEAIRTWLDENGIPCDYINESPWGNDTETSGKIDADVYVDDRGLHFTGDWDDARKQVEQRARKEMEKCHKHFTRKSWANVISAAYESGALIELETAADYAEQHGVTTKEQLKDLPRVLNDADGRVDNLRIYHDALQEVGKILLDRWRNWGQELRRH